MGKQSRIGVLVVGAVVALHGQTRAQTEDGQIAELFGKARPHLEAVLGRRLEKTPQFRTVTAEQLRRQADAEVEGHVRAHFPHLRGQELVRAVQAAQQVCAAATVARHGAGSEIIYVVPDNLRAISRWDDSLAAVNAPELLQLCLVCETARFDLDQRYDLNKRRKECLDAEELQALEACVEGRAQQVTREVARRLGTEALFPFLIKHYLYAPDAGPDAALRLVGQHAVRQRHWAAQHGLAFCTYLADRGVRDAEKQVFERLPRQVRWITRPQLYVQAVEAKRADLAAVMARLQGAVPQAEWVGAQQSWTPAMIRQVAGMLNEKARAEKVLETWDEGRTLVWTHKNHAVAQVALSVVRYETAAGARGYFGFAVDLQRKRDETPGACGPALKVLESTSTALKLAGVDEAVRTDKRIQLGADAQPIPVSMVLVRAGELVIECSWHGFTADPAWAERIINATLKAAKQQSA